VIAVGANGRFVIFTQAQLEEFPKSLWVRVLGTIFLSPATAPAAASGYGVGLGITHEEIGAGGLTAPPDPFAQIDHRWQWWAAAFPQIGGTGAADQNASRWAGYFQFVLDQRLKERLQDNEELVLMVKNDAASAASIQVSYALRFLFAVGAK